MTRNEVLQIRISPALRNRLQRLRNERHVNISAWLRDLISAALDREFPPPADPSAPLGSPSNPLPGWHPYNFAPKDWGAAFTGDTTGRPAELVGLTITVTPRSKGSKPWDITISKVIKRTDRRVIVRTPHRPKL